MADDLAKSAVDVIAHHVVATRVECDWEDYPDLGEYDWEAVEKRADAIADSLRPSDEQYQAAYDFLKERADPQV